VAFEEANPEIYGTFQDYIPKKYGEFLD